MDDVAVTLTELLKQGGPWGIVTVCMVAIVYLFRLLQASNKERLADAREILAGVASLKEIAAFLKDNHMRDRQ